MVCGPGHFPGARRDRRSAGPRTRISGVPRGAGDERTAMEPAGEETEGDRGKTCRVITPPISCRSIANCGVTSRITAMAASLIAAEGFDAGRDRSEAKQREDTQHK